MDLRLAAFSLIKSIVDAPRVRPRPFGFFVLKLAAKVLVYSWASLGTFDVITSFEEPYFFIPDGWFSLSIAESSA